MGAGSFELVRRRTECEPGDCRPEIFSGFPAEKIGAFHRSLKCFKDAITIVLVGLSGRNGRLLADNALAFDFFHASARMVDIPVAPENLNGRGSPVFDPHKVGEYEFSRHGI